MTEEAGSVPPLPVGRRLLNRLLAGRDRGELQRASHGRSRGPTALVGFATKSGTIGRLDLGRTHASGYDNETYRIGTGGTLHSDDVNEYRHLLVENGLVPQTTNGTAWTRRVSPVKDP